LADGEKGVNRIRSIDDIGHGVEALCRVDPRLAAVRTAAGDIPLRLSPSGFESLASIIVSQQVSLASAKAIFGRFRDLLSPFTPAAVALAEDGVFRQAGLSQAKQRTLIALARAVGNDGLDLAAICELPAEAATQRLTAVSGIGPWTAQCYLLFAAGHPDVFPAGDVALQTAVGSAFGIEPRPDAKKLAAIAESWTPWRSVAARLFWAYYREMRGREALPLAENRAEA
jgi:DNA-3-methyladenine glycosylase II